MFDSTSSAIRSRYFLAFSGSSSHRVAPGGAALPARQPLQNRLGGGNVGDGGGKLPGFAAIHLVSNADRNLFEAVENIQLGDGQFVDTINHAGVAGRHRIEPSATAGRPVVAPNSRPTWRSSSPKASKSSRRKRSFSDPGGVGFDHSPDVANPLGRNPGAGAGAAGDRVAAGDKG